MIVLIIIYGMYVFILIRILGQYCDYSEYFEALLL